MGQGGSQFSNAELEQYEEFTFFSKKEILYVHKRFKELSPERVNHNRNAKLSLAKMLTLPELRANPFGDRICHVFSSTKDGACTFDDFLDMMSAFSEGAPKSIKAEYAFRIFDFDGDDYIGKTDLEEIIRRLVLPESFLLEDMELLIQKIFEEADLDDDGMLGFAEFEHVISKSPDFDNDTCKTAMSFQTPAQIQRYRSFEGVLKKIAE